MVTINQFLLQNTLTIRRNPCVSPDFCLDWADLSSRLMRGESLVTHHASRFATTVGNFTLLEDRNGDHAWLLDTQLPKESARDVLEQAVELGEGRWAYPASWNNLLRMKNLVQEHDAASTIFPTATGTLSKQSLGVGARFTTLHWPAVEWAMAELGLSMTANQNSIPRELVYDVAAMLEGRLAGVPFPFIGGDVPEGHQGQSVEGMSHGAVLSKLKTGFWSRHIPWGFNADHQPIGGVFDSREAELVRGSLLASYITFDLSPELSITQAPADPKAWCEANVPAHVLDRVRARVAQAGLSLGVGDFEKLVAAVWPAMLKMQRRDRLYAEARRNAFSVGAGCAYYRELSIDELPGLTTPETLATMLALCEALDVSVQFVAPAFGFQKNFPFDDNAELERRIGKAWDVCRAFGVSIGFHSGSGKSADNYRICGKVTGTHLEIKTSGRYTYEMGRALSQSSDPADQTLWRDWYAFTRSLAVSSAFGSVEQERKMARSFIVHALEKEGKPTDVFASESACSAALEALTPSPDHMFWFEYNFLFVLAAEGKADKAALGDHSPAGYRQRARFYTISAEGRLRYAQNVASYLCFLAETTGMVSSDAAARARTKLESYSTYAELVADIAPAT
jgi:hypothetical protein